LGHERLETTAISTEPTAHDSKSPSAAWSAILRGKLEERRRITTVNRLEEGGSLMMGTKARLFTPIAAHSLDELVPPDHFYRHLDRALDLCFV